MTEASLSDSGHLAKENTLKQDEMQQITQLSKQQSLLSRMTVWCYFGLGVHVGRPRFTLRLRPEISCQTHANLERARGAYRKKAAYFRRTVNPNCNVHSFWMSGQHFGGPDCKAFKVNSRWTKPWTSQPRHTHIPPETLTGPEVVTIKTDNCVVIYGPQRS